MAVYHTPVALTRTPAALGPFADKVSCQVQGGKAFLTDLNTAGATIQAPGLADGDWFDLPVGAVVYVWAERAAGVSIVMMRSLA